LPDRPVRGGGRSGRDLGPPGRTGHRRHRRPPVGALRRRGRPVGRSAPGIRPRRRLPHGGVMAVALWLLGAVVLTVFLGSWVLQIALWLLDLALRLVGWMAAL